MTDDEIAYTVEIASSWLAANPTAMANIPKVLEVAKKAVVKMKAEDSKLKPAVSVKDSVTDDYIICLEDGKKLTMLRRYLKTKYNMTPEDYRAKWGLAASYPMTAPNYTKTRAKLAKKSGLGKK